MRISPVFALKIFLIGSFLTLLGCSTTDNGDKYTGQDQALEFPYRVGKEVDGATQPAKKVFPWEIWTPNKDLEGLPLVNFAILAGDESMRQGNRERALQEYLAVDRRRLLPQEQEALSLRIASTQLSLGDNKAALATISEFFASRQESADYVSAPFSIVLAFAYGRSNQLDQSLAWFSRAHKLAGQNRSIDQIVAYGVRSSLRNIPSDQFEKISAVWEQDGYIRELIAKEREFRSHVGTQLATQENQDYGTLNQQPINTNAINVAVLLPLSGKFAALGRSTANGIELSLSGAAINAGSDGSASTVGLVVRDTTGDALVAASQVREVSTANNPAVIIGPLLSDAAQSAAEMARQNRVPLLAFSKKNAFATGQGVFRLGATASSQVDSILRLSHGAWNLNRYAVVYPSDANGVEFASAFKSQVVSLGADLTIERAYTKDDNTSFLAIAQEIEKSQVQAVFFPDNILAASRFFSNFNPAFREKIKIFGTANWDNLNQLSRFQNVLNGATFVSPFFLRSQRPVVAKFIEAYRAKYNQEPDFLAAQGFDAGTMVFAALERSAREGSFFAQALSEIGTYEGLTGRIVISPSGECTRTYSLVEFKDGGISEIGISEANPAYVMRGDVLDSGINNPNQPVH